MPTSFPSGSLSTRPTGDSRQILASVPVDYPPVFQRTNLLVVYVVLPALYPAASHLDLQHLGQLLDRMHTLLSIFLRPICPAFSDSIVDAIF